MNKVLGLIIALTRAIYIAVEHGYEVGQCEIVFFRDRENTLLLTLGTDGVLVATDVIASNKYDDMRNLEVLLNNNL